MRIRYYIAIFFVMISSVVYGARVDWEDQSLPTWTYVLVLIIFYFIGTYFDNKDK